MNFNEIKKGYSKPNSSCTRLLPMPLIIFLISFSFSFIQDTKSQNTAYDDISIVDTKQLLSLIKTKDDTIRLFNFWATWCKPCVGELPYFEELNTLKKNEKFRLYLVSLDFPKDYRKRLIPFLKKRKMESTVLLFDGGNPNDWIDKINPDWSGAIPSSLVSYKGQTCFEENSFENLAALTDFFNHCKTYLKT
jgi:thiol-disulfide isomerase/thioredoxin